MSDHSADSTMELPESLGRQLQAFRGTVRRTKMLEAAGIALVAILVGFLAIFIVDRWLDAPSGFRWLVFLMALIGVATLPIWFQRWVVRHRSHAAMAKLMARKLPALGDSLLGAVELASNVNEQSRSPALCRAALQQVAAEVAKRDLRDAAPDAYHLRWWALVSIAAVGVLLVGWFYPAASANAWTRFAMPWSSTPRYTFAKLQPLPSPWVVPHGEPVTLQVPLTEDTAWTPKTASMTSPKLPRLDSQWTPLGYRFELPPLIQPTSFRLRVGDAHPVVPIQPVLRPQLVMLSAEVTLPAYLRRPGLDTRDVRGGTLSLVEGSTFKLSGQASRELMSASLDGTPIHIEGDRFATATQQPQQTNHYQLNWEDVHALKAKLPFPLQVQVRADEQPTVFAEGLPRSKVVLDSEQLQFQVHASDDFGVQRIGMEWRTAEGASTSRPVHGEWILMAGSPTSESLEANSIFQATALKIDPQPIELRIFVEDYFPNRSRIYSAPHLLHVLSASDHAVWVLQQLNRWQREALEVRDRELQLLEGNKKLREHTPDELASDAVRTQIEQQAAAEQANARRLSGLNQRGEELLRQAARNQEIGVGHLEKWAEMHQILKDIAANRMPSVANLLKQAAKAAKGAATPTSASRVAGSNRSESSGNSTPDGEEEDKDASAKPAAPRVVDAESSQQPADESEGGGNKKSSSPGSLGLPSTTVVGSSKSASTPEAPAPAASVDAAIEQQLTLLEEFDKVSEELNKVMANLEGSTLVKRFKAAAREQIEIADTTSQSLPAAFGVRAKRLKEEDRGLLEKMSVRENAALNTVGNIIDDLEAFHERRPMIKFRDVLENIRQEDPLAGLRKLSQQVTDQQGLAIAEAEYWSDTFDRWAEDLVDPACKGQCPGSKSKGSLPPSIVLEVMQILEAEMNLRDRTRVVEQSRTADAESRYVEAAGELARNQTELEQRVVAVREKIEQLPNAQEDFGKELELMQSAASVMQDAARILARPDTGRAAIAAETEAIELLLQSKRVNPKSGGGGGTTPGGGGGGDTSDAAIALVGPGQNEKEIRQDHGVEQSSGTSGSELPEEFRYGLDQYFDRVERRPSQ